MKKEKAKKPPMSFTKKLVLTVLGILLTAFIIYLAYYFIHYRCYNKYRDFVTDYEYEEGSAFSAMQESKSSVKGFSLVAENDYLKLYTDTATTNVAVYDKRNGNITYAYPLNADNDEVANGTNINYLKSAVILGYYNSDVTPGAMDSYSGSVKNGNFTVESIENGVRFVFTIGDTKEDAIHFEVPVEYRLNEDGVDVSVPVKGIKEYNGSIYRIQLCRNFGAARYDEEGYIVVPNGSGSIINFNNGKTAEAQYSQYIYDLDPLVSNYTSIENTVGAKLPIAALCRNNSTLLMSVEEGACVSYITAGISNVYNEYNYTYASFVIRNADNLKMFGNSTSDVYVLEENPYDINCTVKYSFLTEEYTGYSGVAAYYRNRLISEGALTKAEEATDIPFYMDVITGVQETGHILGVQYLHTFAMTTYEEAGEMSDELTKLGVENQVINLQGWFNKGYYNYAPHTIKLVNKAGSKKELEALNEKLNEKGGRLYADVAIQKVPFSDSGFNYSAEASKYYTGYAASFGVTNPTTLRNTANLGYMERRYNLLSPRYLSRYVAKFSKKIEDYDIDGISLRDLGNTLASDKRKTLIIDREKALDIVEGQFEVLKATGKKLMNSEANAYAFAYSDDIINAPLYDNNFKIIDAQIPLYAMIIHGYIPYSSTLLNYDDSMDMTQTILQLIENGASPHYVFTYDKSSEMKDTGLNHYYATTFDTWKDEAAEVYESVNEALKYVSNAEIVEHKIYDNGLRCVSYDNGVKIYVNYTENELDADGVEVSAKSYRLEGK